jgi:hypothetical protein
MHVGKLGVHRTSVDGEPIDCLAAFCSFRSSRCFLSSASFAFFARISSRRCCIVVSMANVGVLDRWQLGRLCLRRELEDQTDA